jgi:RimJ/RimL family protein N-acetyltransferase
MGMLAAMTEEWAIPLEGELVTLGPLIPQHEDELWAALDDDEVWAWIPIGRPDRQAFSRFFQFLLGSNTSEEMVTWVVRMKSSGEVVGMSSYLAIREEHRGVEIGFTLHGRQAWGSGSNIEAKKLMLGHGFEDLGLQRIEFKTDARNERSRGALAALPA